MGMSPRIAELRDKCLRAGLDRAEAAGLKQLEFLAAQTVDTDAQYRKVDTEKLRQRIAGRVAAETIVELCRGEIGTAAHKTDWLRGFFQTIHEFLQAAYPVAGPQIPQPMTDREAREFGAKPMAFGKFAGTPIAETERAYLDWLAGEQAAFSHELTRYLKNEKIADELQIELESLDFKYDER